MAIQPEEFDIPVVDYSFHDVASPRSLIDQMATAGGFTATKLAMARDILRDMKSELDAVEGDATKVCNWL
ncbi:MAG: hypothetical protein QF699_05010 [Candidatus Poseidoniaceae archaeon]|nr:hypothetical protein [Candidatus Poseidoniaceae archaeon]